MKQFKLLMLVCSTILFACSKENSGSEKPEVLDTAKMAGTNWVPARAKMIKEMTYEYTAVVPYKDASGKLVYDKANSEKRQGKGHVYYDEKYQVVYVVDWPGAQASAAEGAFGFRPFYFNFDTRDTVSVVAAQANTATWHVKHFDIYNAYMLSDASTAVNEPGLGKMRVVRTAFDELDEAPASAMIRNSVEIEMDENPTVDGWGTYRLSDHILRPYKHRTIIFQLRDGRYVKYQLASLYRTNPKVVNDKYEYEAPYYNFRYYIQQTPNNKTVKTR
nr:HmuY family protein [Pedobacter panaciterrae]